MKIIKCFLIALFTVSLISSCGTRDTGSKEKADPAKTQEYTFDKFLEDAKEIPLSVTSISDVHQFFALAHVSYDAGLCNDVENVSMYKTSHPAAAVNIGVYMADLIYHTYGRSYHTAPTADAAFELAEYVGMEKDFYENAMARYEDANVPMDSLIMIWNVLLDESGKYGSESEIIYLKTALIFGNYIEKLYLISSVLHQEMASDITDEEATLAKQELAYALIRAQEHTGQLYTIVEEQKDLLKSMAVLEELQILNDLGSNVALLKDDLNKLSSGEILSNQHVISYHAQIVKLREAIVNPS